MGHHPEWNIFFKDRQILKNSHFRGSICADLNYHLKVRWGIHIFQTHKDVFYSCFCSMFMTHPGPKTLWYPRLTWFVYRQVVVVHPSCRGFCEAVMLRHAAAYGVFDDEKALLQAMRAMMFMYRNNSFEARTTWRLLTRCFVVVLRTSLDPRV